ncbi:predicted protein [Naegleria gruberi]|uniref:Predicted protein n=1 Tax=Naegleria gruberi TaxID=5762 RepID=D2VA77_NAEGR|nr:uncharacterized protein NAEGRDRAFT_65764 [Naegleria gruberi]EFC46381.1 predicted protein [Naegleria gruberi]|eukprot:XP_002679125.1 predicted protein [Naegleria gruberi strain NEG-M]
MNTPLNSCTLVLFSIVAILFLLNNSHATVVATSQQQQVATPCTPVDKDYKFSWSNEYAIALECQVGPDYNQFKMNYSSSGYGASVYFLTEPQYNDFVEKVKANPAYVPPSIAEYMFYFYFPNSGYLSSKGNIVTLPRTDLGKIRVLVKRNPSYEGATARVFIDLTIIPQQDNTAAIVIAVASVGGIIGVLCCVGCCAGLIFFVLRRRKASYQQVV